MTSIDLDLPAYATDVHRDSAAARRSALAAMAQSASATFWQAVGAAGAMCLAVPPAERDR